jgi:Fe-S cluster biosynthesis and repair protein YggX
MSMRANETSRDFPPRIDLFKSEPAKHELLAPHKIELVDSGKQAVKPDEEIRKDPEEEYFRLSVLALKVLYNEKDNDFVFEVSPGKLFKKAKRNKIPFHQYYPWIEQQLMLCNEKINPDKQRDQHRGILSKITNAIYSLRSPQTETPRDAKISQK